MHLATSECERALKTTSDRWPELLRGDPSSVSDGDLLAVLIGEAKADAVVRWARERGVAGSPWSLDPMDLSAVPGIGQRACVRVAASAEIGRRRAGAMGADRPLLSSPEAVIEFCGPILGAYDREHFWMLALDAKNRLIQHREVSVGIVDATVVHPREVYKDAVRLSAAGIVVVHNHPSGDPQPSRADIRLTGRLAEAGKVLGIPLIDHVIVSASGIGYSLREHGELG